MLGDPQRDQNSVGTAESRGHPRLQVHSLAYIELSDDNAGLILNISESGIAVQAVQVLTSDYFPRMRFRLPKTENLIEVSGRMVWQIRSKKEAGIEFVGLGEKTRAQIRAWLAAERARSGLPSEVSGATAAAEEMPRPAEKRPHPAEPRPARQSPPTRGGIPTAVSTQSPDPGSPSSRGTGDWVSQQRRPTPVSDRGDQDARGADHTDRTSRFRLPPIRLGSAGYRGDGYPEDEDATDPGRIPAMPRWNGYMAPGVGMEFKKPRGWWTYTAALGFIAALGFAGLMMFSPDTITRARIDALTRMHNTPADTQASGQNGEANNQQQQNNPGSTDTAQNPQPVGQVPSPNDTTATSTPNQPLAGNAPAPSASSAPSASGNSPASGTAIPGGANNPAASGSNRPSQTAPVAPPSQTSGGRNYVQQPVQRHNQPNPTKSPATGKSATPHVNRNQPAYSSNRNRASYQNQQPSRYSSQDYSSQNRATQNSSVPENSRYSQSTAANPPASSYQPNGVQPQNTPASDSVNTENRPAAVNPTAAQPARQNPPQQTQNPAQQTAGTNTNSSTTNNSTGQQAAAPSSNQSPLEAWRAQTTLPPANSAANPANSSRNQQPAPSQQTAQQRDQDAYARRPATAAPPSNPAASRSSQPTVSSVEMPGSTSPVLPSVPLAGVPSGSVGATSQFHAIRIPPELQSQSSQLAGNLEIGQLLSSYSPVYPVEAAREGIEGTVRLDVLVGKDGTVRNVRVISGPAMLTSAAATAVRDWRYGETFLSGQPIETQQYVTVVFRLAAKTTQR